MLVVSDMHQLDTCLELLLNIVKQMPLGTIMVPNINELHASLYRTREVINDDSNKNQYMYLLVCNCEDLTRY